jgi:endonuclease YncB( thermonuclease family)
MVTRDGLGDEALTPQGVYQRYNTRPAGGRLLDYLNATRGVIARSPGVGPTARHQGFVAIIAGQAWPSGRNPWTGWDSTGSSRERMRDRGMTRWSSVAGLDRTRRWRREPEAIARGSALGLILALLLAASWVVPAWGGAPRPSIEGGGSGQPLGPPESTSRKLWGTVRSVTIGTLLEVATPDDGSRQLRLYGIEPPERPRPARASQRETPGQPYGVEALSYVRDLLDGKLVRIETFGKDRRGRTLAVVWLGDVNVNLTMVKEGLAWVSPAVSDSRVRAELEVAEQQAQKAKYGLWSLPNPEPPWEYRNRLRVPAE